MPEYALILLGLLVLTIFLHKYFRLVLWRNLWHMVIVYGIMVVILVVWDEYAIWRGLWSYGKQYLLGIYVGHIPIEDIGFLFVPSYLGLVVYKIIERIFDKKHLR